MVHRSSTSSRSRLVLCTSVLAAACGGGGGVGNGTPHVSAIPQQSTLGGAAVSLDLSTYVTDREGDALTYSVVSGGGSFTGSTFDNTFDTMGTYTVDFQVTDSVGNVAASSFEVVVTSAHYAVVGEDATGMLLLDTMTNAFVRVAANAATPAFAAGLADGKMVYSRGAGSVQQLWLYDAFTRTARQIGSNALTYVTYRAKTSDDRIVLTTGTAPDTDLYVYNPRTNLLTEVSAVDGEMDGDALVNGADLVFYERGDGGQNDIYYYDPTTDTSTAVSTDANDEELLAVLPDNGIVFSRVGAGGEHDLFYFKRGTGTVEIGTNVTALATADKAYGGAGSNGEVVFTADDTTDVAIYFWSPSTGLATAIATSGTFGFEGIGAGNEVVYRQENSGSDHDLFFYDLDDATAGTVRNAADLSSLLAITTDGSTAWAIVTGSSTNNAFAVSLVSSPVTSTYTGSSAPSLGGVLGNGDVVLNTASGSELAQFDVSTGIWGPIAGTGLVFGGAGIDAGDFVYRETASSQTDLKMWDDSATTVVDISTVTGDDEFAACTTDGTILFTRVVSGNTNSDLFVWEPVGGAVRLTDVDEALLAHDHTVTGMFDAAR